MHTNSTTRPPSGKPAAPSTENPGGQPGVKPVKPYDDFPLFPHASGRWAKKIRGKMHYFGSWRDGADAVLQRYLDQKDHLHAGRTPRQAADAVTIKDLVNAYLNFKQGLVDSGELTARSWRDYKQTGDLLVQELGKQRLVIDVGPSDFAGLRRVMAKRWGLHRLAKNIQYARSIFLHGVESDLIDRAIKFGPGFELPSKKNFRLQKARQGVKLFTAEEIRDLIDGATQPMKSMILLGINCGYGNADCGILPTAALNLKTGWIDFPRPKTGMGRRCPLWPETISALREWFEQRPTSADDAHVGIVFLTAKGDSWFKETSDNPVSKEMSKLMKRLGIGGARNFYVLRHTHRTVGDAVCDQRASGFIMGHIDASMAGVYVENISDERLRAVTERVRGWLYAKVACENEENL